MAWENLSSAIKDAAFKALYIGAEGIMTKAIDAAPIRTGTLRRSHTVTPQRSRMAVSISANTPYAEPVHEGYGPFEIVPRAKKALYWKGAKYPVKRVHHPGYGGNPWLKRTVEANMDKVGRYVLLRVKEAIGGEFPRGK